MTSRYLPKAEPLAFLGYGRGRAGKESYKSLAEFFEEDTLTLTPNNLPFFKELYKEIIIRNPKTVGSLGSR